MTLYITLNIDDARYSRSPATCTAEVAGILRSYAADIQQSDYFGRTLKDGSGNIIGKAVVK